MIEDIQVENAPADGIQITSLSKNAVAPQASPANRHISNAFVTNCGSIGFHVDPGNTGVSRVLGLPILVNRQSIWTTPRVGRCAAVVSMASSN